MLAKFFIGTNPWKLPATVCKKSLVMNGVPEENIFFLDTAQLRSDGCYWRTHDETQSTDFSYTRFLVPYLSNFSGISVFMDEDFFWRGPALNMFYYYNPAYAVTVVKHNITSNMLSTNKMDNKRQEWYPKKNWSSLMIFNNAHSDCNKLIPSAVSEQSPEWLHQFKWTNLIGEMPHGFNSLVGYEGYPENPAGIHFTDGGPWHNDLKYKESPFALEWSEVAKHVQL